MRPECVGRLRTRGLALFSLIMARLPNFSAVFAALALAACASGPRYEGQVYRGDGIAFRTGPVPASWSRVTATGTRLAFRDEAARATMLVNGRCGRDADDVPLAALTEHLFLRFTERTVDDEKLLPFDGREALRTVMTAKLDGVPRKFEAVVMKKDGCVYDLILITAPDDFTAAQAAFEPFVTGFHAGDDVK